MLVTLAVIAGGAGAQEQAPIGSVTIDGTKYLYGQTTWLLSVVPSPAVRRAIAIISKCKTLKSYGFGRPDGFTPRFGLVLWAPTDISDCLTAGAESGGPAFTKGCLELYRTPSNPNPVGAQPANSPSQPQRFVLIAATSSEMCAHLSTQVPGGVWGRSRNGSGSYLIKCQRDSRGYLEDYVAPWTANLPADKPDASTGYINDGDIGTNASRLRGVPMCSGYSIDLSQ